MDDLDDIAEAVVDVEDIAEEVFEPDELLKDFEANPLGILLALGGFLYVRSGVPHRVERKINRKRAAVEDRTDERTGMTEEEAIDELRDQYATGKLTEEELEEALEDVITSDDPERAVRAHDPDDEYERAYGRE